MSGRSRRSIYIDDEQWVALAEIGKRDDRSVANLVRQAVSAYLASHGVNGNLRKLYEAWGGNPADFDEAVRASSGEPILTPETLGPDIRTTGEPVLPADKLVEP